MKVKMFSGNSYPPTSTEAQINEFLDNDDIQLIDIKTTEVVGNHDEYSYTALVIYRDLAVSIQPWDFDQANK